MIDFSKKNLVLTKDQINDSLQNGEIDGETAKRLFEQRLASTKNWRKQQYQCKLALKQTPVYDKQTDLPTNLNIRGNGNLPIPLEDLADSKVQYASPERLKEIEERSKPGGSENHVYQRSHIKRFRDSLGAKATKERNTFNRKNGTDHKGEIITGFCFVSEQEQDYLDNIFSLFPEHYQDQKR